MSGAEFEPAIPVCKRPKTARTLCSATTARETSDPTRKLNVVL